MVEYSWVCSICGQGYTSLVWAFKHIYDEACLRRFSCRLCGKSFKRQSNRKQHEDRVQHVPYICSWKDCNATFWTKVMRDKHFREVHLGRGRLYNAQR
mmetsp:Transcript_20368/g.29564  ORF Transcript_20368/g.29564 Transcript_20368/m.29564 type:complete len:98 (-) Transcript_20368:94-387(-)